MPNSIYDQMGAALGQASRQGERTILYRGKVIECVVLIGANSTKLGIGGLETISVTHVKVLRSLIPIGQDGEPHTTEAVTFPATTMAGLIPKEFVIEEIIPEEFAYSFSLVDPTK